MAEGPSEAELERAVTDFQEGVRREEAFQVLVRRFYRPFRSYFKKRGVPEADRDDLVQDAFLSLYTGLDGFRREAKLSTWVFRIAYHTYCQWGRRRGREPEFDSIDESPDGAALDPVSEDESADDHAMRRQRLAWLEEALKTLPPRMRQCLVLRVSGEMSYDEIAKTMDCSVNTVKAQLFNARRRLQAMERQQTPPVPPPDNDQPPRPSAQT